MKSLGFDGGVYFGKNVFPDLVPSTTKFYDDLKRNNFSLAYFHEEGGVFLVGKQNGNQDYPVK